MEKLAVPVLMFVTACDPSAPVTELCDFDPEGYRHAAAALDRARAARDGRALEEVIAEDFLWVRGTGATADKESYIGALTADSLTVEPFQAENPEWISTISAALLTGTRTRRGSSNGGPFLDRHRFAEFWVWRDCRWQLVYSQVTPVAAQGE